MIETLQTGSPKVIGFRVSGRLHDEDYKLFVPAVDAAVEAEGKIRLFAQFEDFHGCPRHDRHALEYAGTAPPSQEATGY